MVGDVIRKLGDVKGNTLLEKQENDVIPYIEELLAEDDEKFSLKT
jgi:hypothetical protein